MQPYFRCCVALLLSALGTSPSFAQSSASCDAYARDYAHNASRQGQVLRGGAVGSLVGFGIGSFAGAAGTGAAIGAGIGMVGGGLRRAGSADRLYRAAYDDCMAARRR